ncbi:L-serine ammonia-lyase [Actinomycetota bacterium]
MTTTAADTTAAAFTGLSVLDLFSVGIGPSSSHTVGPMRAARMFARELADAGQLDAVAGVKVELYGSLGATGRGHGSDTAVLLGLLGEEPETLDANAVPDLLAQIERTQQLALLGSHPVALTPDRDVVLIPRKSLPGHANGMIFRAFDEGGTQFRETVYYSIGGGFVVTEGGELEAEHGIHEVPHPFTTGEELLARCAEGDLRISDVMLANEESWRPEAETRAALLHVWEVMRECVDSGCHRSGLLPGGLKVPRRAPGLYEKLMAESDEHDPLRAMDWINLYALAVNEENASGGRVVTAPTNGAAGIIPAVLHYYEAFVPDADEDGVIRFLLTAGAIGMLIKHNASISGAEVGCQGEVGSACAMAAAGLAEVLGCTPEQVENAAEVGIEHNLGLTCDPIGGLVQIPCIERNAIAAVKAINAARLSRRGDGSHHVSLDQAIKTLRDTGKDMKSKYKETSRGGLAVNVIEC